MQKLKQRLQHKRIFGMGGILAGILAFTGTVYGAPEEMPEENQVAYAEVSTCLNIREGAGMEYPVIARLPKDGYCEVKKEEGAWCYIESEEIEGYVYKSYLETGMNQETYLRRTGREEPVYAYKVENVEMNTAGKGQEIADFALQFCGQSLCLGRNQSDKRRRLLRLCPECIQKFWDFSAKSCSRSGTGRNQSVPGTASDRGFDFLRRWRSYLPCGLISWKRTSCTCQQRCYGY